MLYHSFLASDKPGNCPNVTLSWLCTVFVLVYSIGGTSKILKCVERGVCSIQNMPLAPRLQ